MSTRLKRVALHTLGCKLNFAETDTLARRFEEAGYETAPFTEAADVYVINSCTVTEHADTECRQLVRRAKKINPECKVVVTGCYAELKPDHIRQITGVDWVIGNHNKFNLVSQVEQRSINEELGFPENSSEANFHAAYSYASRTRSFLKVQDGCDYQCTFCTIPLARGLSRSSNIKDVLTQVLELSKKGIKEIVLTGINLGDFGYGPQRRPGQRKTERFIDLLKALDETKTIERFRISSVEPNLLSASIINFIAGSKRFAKHVHMPLQSGSDEILNLMKRRYKAELYQDRVLQIKSLIPHAAIGCDVIVGFPGERNPQFEATYKLLSDLDITYLHVFSYSERVNTPAIHLNPKIQPEERRRRSAVLRKLSDEKLQAFSARFDRTTGSVLWEQPQSNRIRGYTDNYIRVESSSHKHSAGSIEQVMLKWDSVKNQMLLI